MKRVQIQNPKVASEAEREALAEEEEILNLEEGGDQDESRQIALPDDILEEADINLLQLHNLNAFDVDDDDVGGGAAKPSSSAGGRHSESKKEMLKVIENTINRLMKERAELDKIQQQLSEGEARAERELQMYMDMLKHSRNMDLPEQMGAKEWEKFFNFYFVNGGQLEIVKSRPKKQSAKGEKGEEKVPGAGPSAAAASADSDDEGRRSDMEMD